jgi:uncharacterized protein (TIGR04168 family)
MIRIGILGDIHQQFDAVDVDTFNRASYDHLLITGDLADFRAEEALATAAILSKLSCPTLLIPGNHDLLSTRQFLAELGGPDALRRLTARGQAERAAQFKAALDPVFVGGYSLHRITADHPQLTVIVARPFSFGGPTLGCTPYLTKAYGVDSLDASAAKLCELVNTADTTDLLFLAHNGPTGLGETADAIWGCDFKREMGDFGDSDLRTAIDYAQSTGKRVRAVVAGHMHHALKHGGQRTWQVNHNGVAYINAARVPRIFDQDGRTMRHHIELVIHEETVTVTAVEDRAIG